jgi:antitoxin component YwqK of YwqJK toxin-antitoxin module
MAKDTNPKIEHKKYYYDNVNIKAEYFTLNYKYHRADGPAMICYYENGNIQYEKYYLNDHLHRTDGPASIHYFQNGNIRSKYYYLNSEQINVNSDKEFLIWQKTQILI